MPEPEVVLTFRRKRGEIESVIAAYQEKIEAAERDLSAVAATLRLFELNGEPEQFPAHLAQLQLVPRYRTQDAEQARA